MRWLLGRGDVAEAGIKLRQWHSFDEAGIDNRAWKWRGKGRGESLAHHEAKDVVGVSG